MLVVSADDDQKQYSVSNLRRIFFKSSLKQEENCHILSDILCAMAAFLLLSDQNVSRGNKTQSM